MIIIQCNSKKSITLNHDPTEAAFASSVLLFIEMNLIENIDVDKCLWS